MSVFKVYADDKLFYHPAITELSLTKAEITEDAESIDSFQMSVPAAHPYLDDIKMLSTYITCVNDGETVFEGRVLDINRDFYGTRTFTCEGSLAYLKDSIQPPFNYTGTLRGLLEYFISVHNENVEEAKRFKLGTLTVTDSNDYVAYSSTDHLVTLDAIKTRLLNTHGGYLRVRYNKKGRYLDYLSDFTTASLQTVEYGKNLLDVKITSDSSSRVSVLIPLGAIIEDENMEEESEKRIDITSVNDGKNYITDEDAIGEIGYIWKTEVWDDVTIPGNLLIKGKARLAELSKGITSMQLSIVDESDTDADIGDIRARMYVDVKSKVHGINGTYLCLSRTRDYINRSGNRITIGANGVSLSKANARQGQSISDIENDITGQEKRIVSALSGIENTGSAINALKENIHECYAEIAKSSDEIKNTVHDTYIEKSDLETIQADFQSSITQNSSEIRIDFTTITNEIIETVEANRELLEEYIRFKGALIELGKIGNAFTAELSNEELAFKENGLRIAYISNNSLVITNAEIRNKLSLGNESRGWFDFIPRTSGNLSIKWRGTS